MTNAQNATYHAVREIASGMPLDISAPEPMHEGQYSSVVFKMQRRNGLQPITFMIEAGGCLARIYYGE